MVKLFQVFLSNISNSIHQIFLCNKKNAFEHRCTFWNNNNNPMYGFINHCTQAECDTRSIFERNLIILILQFSFS